MRTRGGKLKLILVLIFNEYLFLGVLLNAINKLKIFNFGLMNLKTAIQLLLENRYAFKCAPEEGNAKKY